MNRPIGLSPDTTKAKSTYRRTPTSIRIVQSTIQTLEKVAPKLSTLVAWRLFCTPIRHKLPEREKTAFLNATKSNVKIGIHTIQMYRWGHPSDPLILFLHGWSGRGTQVASILTPLLKNGFQILAVDAPAHGLSSGKTTNILEIAKVVEYIGMHYPLYAAIGHSLGGVVLHYSRRGNALFEKMVTISSPMESTFMLQDFIEKIGGSQALAYRIKEFIRQKFAIDFDSVSPLYPATWPDHLRWLVVHDQDDHDVPVGQAYAVKDHHLNPQLAITGNLGHYRILRDDFVHRTIIKWLKN